MESGDTYFYLISAAFLTGFVLQGAWITSQKKNRKKYLLAVLATLITYFFSIVFLRGNLTTSEPASVIAFPMMVLLFFLVVLFKETLPRIGTQTVLLYTVFFWFVWSDTYFNILSIFLKSDYGPTLISSLISADTIVIFILLALVATVIIPIVSTICVIHMDYTRSPLNYKQKLVSYIWFLLVAVSMIASQFPGDMNNPRIKASASPLDVLLKFFEVMLSGMFILQLAFYLSILVSFMRRDREDIYECMERMHALKEKFSDQRLHPFWAYALTAIQVAALALNSYLRIIPNNSMIALLAVVSMQQVTGKENDNAAIMNDIEEPAYENSPEETEEQKQNKRDREQLKELVSKERKSIESHN